MKSKKLQYFKQKLLKEKNEVLETINRIRNHQPNGASVREDTGELSAYDNHPADLGTEMFITTMQANLENHEKYRIQEINRALEMIEEGTYGLCKMCGESIPEERLEVMPEANLCMKCAEDKMPIHIIEDYRPVEEEILFPSFGRSIKDHRDYTGYDGEDTYQDVAKFNEIGNDPSFSGGDYIGIFDEEEPGAVENVENINQEHYLEQLPDDLADLDLNIKRKKHDKKS